MQTFYDLFAGIGGFRLGLECVGFQCVGSCEINEQAKKIYKKNFRFEQEHLDVTRLDARNLSDHDILCAGFPCQAFSTAGKRLGFADTRGTLFFEIARIAREKRPQMLFLENVKGLLSHDSGRTFATVLLSLHEIGYALEWQVVNGRYFLPQNMERVFIVGHLGDRSFKQVFPVGDYGQIPEDKEKGPVAKCLTEGWHSGGLHSQMTVINTDTRRDAPESGVVQCLDANYTKGPTKRETGP